MTKVTHVTAPVTVTRDLWTAKPGAAPLQSDDHLAFLSIMTSYISSLLWGTSQLDDAVGTFLRTACRRNPTHLDHQTRQPPSYCQAVQKTLPSISRYATKSVPSLFSPRTPCALSNDGWATRTPTSSSLPSACVPPPQSLAQASLNSPPVNRHLYQEWWRPFPG